MHNRSDRMGDEIRRILAELIQRKLSDPRIQERVSLTGVDLSRDLSNARVYYSVYGDEEASREAALAFDKAGGFLRKELAGRLRSRKVPRLIFVEDKSIREGEAIDLLLRKIREEEGRGPQEEGEDHGSPSRGQGGEPTA